MEDRCADKTDEELVALVLKDQEYFGCLMKKYSAPLSRYVDSPIFGRNGLR